MISKRKIAIIGGGAAGMMAAATLAEESRKDGGTDVEILLFEKNAYLGAKVLISGGGRCNVTTGIFDVRKLLESYPRGAKFLMSAMYRFSPEKVMEWFETHGVRLKVEDDLRVFPRSNQGKDVVGVFEKILKENGVRVLLNANVGSVHSLREQLVPPAESFSEVLVSSTESSSELPKFLLELKSGEKFEVDVLVLTTGGNAYRQTGSTGDGYAFAKELGHSLTDFAPSLSSLLVKEPWISKLAGVSFEKVELSFDSSLHSVRATGSKVKKYRRTGAFVFTHRGLSGPAVFALSAMAAYEKFEHNSPGFLKINFFPDKNAEDMKKIFTDLVLRNPRKHLVHVLDFLLPKSLAEIFVELSKVDPRLTVADLRKDQIFQLLQLFQAFPLTVVGRSAGEEFVTAGGVKLDEVNTNTMESKICPGLYFAGEILDVDGFTGGFNLQAAWATGRLIGEKLLLVE